MSRPRPYHVLVIDDEPDLLELLDLTLMRMGLTVDRADCVADALQKLGSQHYDLALTDMRLPDGEGLAIVEAVQRHGWDVPIAVITAFGSLENAVAALKAGAFDYLSKPVSLDQLRTLVKSALNLDRAKATAPTEVADSDALLGQSAAMQQVRQLIDKVARSLAPVYLTGESGSGKERAARLIHQKSPRAGKPFIAVNCGAIPENLMESEFFGYRKGAFTGANDDRDGFFHAAHGGTLFLDEVADLPLPMQVKLLRAIQEKRVRKLGSTQEEPIDVRILCATHQNLAGLVEEGRFRQDLYYRLNVITIRMPALREMRDDIATIATTLLARLASSQGVPAPRIERAALTALSHYDFPGNVRELENVLERALALSDGEALYEQDLQLTPHEDEHAVTPPVGAGDKYPLQDYLDRVEKDAILEALQRTRFNRTQAAKLLGITFRSMRYRMERLGLNDGE